MYVHRAARLVYLAHPRTASVATAACLQDCGFRKLEPPSDHHSRLWDPGSPVTAENREEWTVMTTVRNHWDAAASWAFKRRRLQPVCVALDVRTNRWVREDRLWWLHADDADVVLRYETLADDLRRELARRGIAMPTLGRHNVSSERGGRHYRDVLDATDRDYVAGRFAEEIARFGYAF